MIVAARHARAVCAMGGLTVILALAGCAPSGSNGPVTADQATRAACRQQTEQSFNIRNRADLYRPEYGRDAPLSGQADPQIDRGLSDRFSYEQDYRDCLSSRGARQTPTTLSAPTAAGPTPVTPAPAALPPGRPPASRTSAPSGAGPATPADLTRPPSLTE